MNKKFTSTILLFLVAAGFFIWGISMLVSTIRTGVDGETVVYSLLILGCSGYAFVSLLMLPRRNHP
jgi:hypothetical protein